MSGVGSTDEEPDSGYERLETQIKWYDSKSSVAQANFKRSRIAQLVLAASIPASALFAAPIVSAITGSIIVALQSMEQLNQWQHNWITFRSTCEALRHEKYTYLGRVGSYDDVDDNLAFKLLVERVESLISTEHSKWVGRLQNERKEDC